MATGRAIKAGEAFIELTLKDQKMQHGLRGAIRTMGRLAVSVAKVGTALAAAFGAGAAFTVRRSLREFAQFGDQMEKMSARTGISAQSLTELKFAAEQSGTTIEQLGQAMFRANRRIGNAITNTGPAARALNELGLNAAELANQDPERQLEILTEALRDVDNQGRRSQLAFEIFGDNWRQLAVLINGGTESIEAYRRRSRELLTLTPRQAADAARLTDATNELVTAWRGLRIQLGASLAPAFTLLLEQMTKFLVDWRNWVNQLYQDFVSMLRGVVTIFERSLNAIGAAIGRPELGSNLKDISDIFKNAENFRSSLTSARGGLSNRVFTDMQQATGRSLGSFRGEAQIFGPRGFRQKMLKTLEQVEREQQRTTEAIENKPVGVF